MNTGHALCTCVGTRPRHIKINLKKQGRRQTLAHLDSMDNLPTVGGLHTWTAWTTFQKSVACTPGQHAQPSNSRWLHTELSPSLGGQLLSVCQCNSPHPISHTFQIDRKRSESGDQEQEVNPIPPHLVRREGEGGWGAEELRKGLTAGEHTGSRG